MKVFPNRRLGVLSVRLNERARPPPELGFKRRPRAAKRGCAQCAHPCRRTGPYWWRTGRYSACFLDFPVMLLWLSIRFLSALLLEPFPVACCEVVVAHEASFDAGDNGGPLAEFAGDRIDGQPEAFAFLA